MDMKVGDLIAIAIGGEDFVHASHFRVREFDGDKGVEVECLNGNWKGIYDPEMMMLEIDAPGGYHYVPCTHTVLITTRQMTAPTGQIFNMKRVGDE